VISPLLDNFYTPPVLARDILTYAPSIDPKRIADFAAGDGALLLEAQRRWPQAELIATDLDRCAIRRLTRKLPQIEKEQCNFIDERRRLRSKLLSRAKGTICLVVMNPPFSCRGGRRHHVQAFGTAIPCSLSMSFVLISAEYLHERGQLIAILPSSMNSPRSFAWNSRLS
jgi:tRNA1(Val) A37 N6-methylase TrmN6